MRDTRSRIPIYIVCTQTRHEIDVARLQAPPSWPCARLECAVRSSLREVWVALLPRGRKDGVGLGRRHAKGGGVLDEADKEAHLPDHVMDMLDKSKLDVVNAF